MFLGGSEIIQGGNFLGHSHGIKIIFLKSSAQAQSIGTLVG